LKAIILAAGKGTRLGNYAQFFNKGMIKVGDKGAISHIVEYFPEDTEFIFIVGYLSDLVKQYVKICHPNIKATFVEQNTMNGPGGALMSAYDLIDGPFYIWCADTLILSSLPFSSPFGNWNWIGYAERKSEDNEYSSVQYKLGKRYNHITSFYEKGNNYTGNAYIGCAFIKDYEVFKNFLKNNPIIIDGQLMVSSGFYGLLMNNLDIAAEELNWCDIGDLDKLKETQKKYPSKIENLNKIDEEIYFFDNKVVKYFNNSKICNNRVKRTKILGDLVPKIISYSDNFYSYEYIEGIDLFSIPNPEIVFKDLLDYYNKNLWTEKSLNPEEHSKFQQACVDFYYRKTKDRLDQFYTKFNFQDSDYAINGERIPKTKDLLSVLNWSKILSGRPSLMHGDFNFSNILLTKENTFKLIDWRQDFGGIIEYGDTYYDLAKMLSGLLFPHDLVKQGKYNISTEGNAIHYGIETTESYIKCKEIFYKFLEENNYDRKKVEQLAAIVLLNMAPLHEAPLNTLLFYLGKDILWQTMK
jgi:choline kinase/thiamine kinase-like enzyme